MVVVGIKIIFVIWIWEEKFNIGIVEDNNIFIFIKNVVKVK